MGAYQQSPRVKKIAGLEMIEKLSSKNHKQEAIEDAETKRVVQMAQIGFEPMDIAADLVYGSKEEPTYHVVCKKPDDTNKKGK